jgi:hypothetical protein
MAHNDNQRHAEHPHGEFDRSKSSRVDRISGIANYEKLAEATSEQHFRRDPTIRAANISSEGRLVLSQLKPPLTPRFS